MTSKRPVNRADADRRDEANLTPAMGAAVPLTVPKTGGGRLWLPGAGELGLPENPGQIRAFFCEFRLRRLLGSAGFAATLVLSRHSVLRLFVGTVTGAFHAAGWGWVGLMLREIARVARNSSGPDGEVDSFHCVERDDADTGPVRAVAEVSV